MDWPHQRFAVDEVCRLAGLGCKRILVTTPTGGGKTRIMQRIAERWLDAGLSATIYTNRRILVEQLSGDMLHAGRYHGVRAANYEEEHDHPFQISSIQTEYHRAVKRNRWSLNNSDLALIDEAHLQNNPQTRSVIAKHPLIVGFTATPLGLKDMYDELVIAGTHTELRRCGALVPAIHFGPDEPDMKAFRKLRAEGLSEKDNRRAMMTPTLFGRILEAFNTINRDRRPTFCFGPDVAGSAWIAQKFTENGIRAAHIDSEIIWVDGETIRSDQDVRRQLLNDSRTGRIVVISNRFVLREGVNAPWVSHGIFAAVCSFQSYLQAGGRMLRACDGKSEATIQDHAGLWLRYGSLNADRTWILDYSDHIAVELRADRIRAHKEPEPFSCPACRRILNRPPCPCGWHGAVVRSRPVVSTDGVLRMQSGSAFPERKLCSRADGPRLWEQMYYRARSKKWNATFRQAEAMFWQENYSWPSPRWPLMPTDEMDWFRRVADVSRDRLTQREP